MRPSFSPALPVALLLGLALAGCGSSSGSPGASSSSSSSSAPSSSSSSASASSTGSVDPGSVVLSTDALPSGDGSWTQQSDSTLNGAAGSKARSWSNSTPGQGLEIDVIVVDSASSAQAAWDTWKSKIGAKVQAQPEACPSGAPSNCVELNGAWASKTSDSGSLLVWQQSSVLVAVVLIDSSGTAQRSYAEAVASKESDLIGSAVRS